MDPHGIPGLLIILLYFMAAYAQQLNMLNNQQGMPQFQGNLNSPNQISASNSNKNVRQTQNMQQVNMQEFLNAVNLESQKNSLPQMNFQNVDYQQNPSSPNANLQLLTQQNPLISQSNIANMKLTSPLSSVPNSYTLKGSPGQSIYIDVPQNSGPNSVPSLMSLTPQKISGMKNQPTYSLVSSLPQNAVSQQAMVQNSIMKQNQFIEPSNPSVNCQQNTKPITLIAGEPIITSIQYEPAIYSSGISSTPNTAEGNQFTLSSMRFQPVVPSVQSIPVASSVVSQPSFNSMQFPQTIAVSQNSPSYMSPQYQAAVNSVPNAPSTINQAVMASYLNQPSLRPVQIQSTIENQPEVTSQIQTVMPPMQSTLMSYILSHLGSSSTPKYPKTVGSKGSKSNLKELLPLILDVLKERQNNCGCRNCACMNNNNNEVSIQEPKIFGGYSNQKDYGLNDIIPNNMNSVTECESPKNVLQKNIRQNVINTESAEDSGEDDSDYADDD